jgi:hypothetical protein
MFSTDFVNCVCSIRLVCVLQKICIILDEGLKLLSIFGCWSLIREMLHVKNHLQVPDKRFNEINNIVKYAVKFYFQLLFDKISSVLFFKFFVFANESETEK